LVKLRLRRMGKKKRPFYRIVAINLKAPQQGHALAQVGIYDPINSDVRIDEEKALLWLQRGAVMSNTVKALFDSQGILARSKGLEPRVREDALTQDKPKRRRKLAATALPVEVKDADEEVEAAAVAETEDVVAEAAPETPADAEESAAESSEEPAEASTEPGPEE